MFGQVVIGPPGSGKSTFCRGMHEFLSAVGRKCCIVNLDPANECHNDVSHTLDIRNIISTEMIMRQHHLGPNGALLYAFESLDKKALESFAQTIADLSEQGNYILFDCPGQVELFTHQSSFYRLLLYLTRQKGARLCVVSLMDSIILTSAAHYISMTLLSLQSMLQLGLPQVNVISKIDKVKEYGTLSMPLDYFAAADDIQMLVPLLSKEFPGSLEGNFVRLSSQIAQVIDDYGLLKYEVLAIDDKHSMINLLHKIDQANGYLFGTSEIGGDTIWQEAFHNGSSRENDHTLQERWIEQKDLFDKFQNSDA